MKAITLLGSTGSIGTQTLDLVAQYPDQFRVVGLTSRRNVDLLAAQVRQFQPQIIAIAQPELLPELQERLQGVDPMPQIRAGEEGLCDVAACGVSDLVVAGFVVCA